METPLTLMVFPPNGMTRLKSVSPWIHSRTTCRTYLKVHKNENFFGFDFEICNISLLVMSKY
jgi:hypothetical protein